MTEQADKVNDGENVDNSNVNTFRERANEREMLKNILSSSEKNQTQDTIMANNNNDNTLVQFGLDDANAAPFRVARLDDICVSWIANNFAEYPILDSMPPQYVDNVINSIDLSELPINRACKHVTCDKLWQRMAKERWQYCDVTSHGGQWKRLYLEKHLWELLEAYFPSTDDTNWTKLLQVIHSISPFIHSIILRQLPSRIDLSQILPLFANLSILDVTYLVLDVGMNYVQDDFGISLSDALNVSKYLQSTKTLTSLKLSQCLIDDETIHILMGGLQSNHTVVSLDLSHNKISDVGARRLASWLQQSIVSNTSSANKNSNAKNGVNNTNSNTIGINQTQRRAGVMILNLSDNFIGDEGASHLAKVLAPLQSSKQSQTLNHDSQSNNITNNESISQLIDFDLSMNRITNDGCCILLNALALNETLQTLNLSCNKFDASIIDTLVDMLSANTCLKQLNLNGNQLFCNIIDTNQKSRSSLDGTVTNQENIRIDLNHVNQVVSKLSQCLSKFNSTIVEINLLQTTIPKQDIQTIDNLLQPRKVKQNQSKRKKFIDKSWERLQTTLTL